MNTPPTAPQLHRIFQVQHLVINDVFHDIVGYPRMIKDPADDNCVVRGIVVSEAIARPITAPRHLWASEQAIKKTKIQVFEDAVEIVGVTSRRTDAFAASHLPYQVRLARHVLG